MKTLALAALLSLVPAARAHEGHEHAAARVNPAWDKLKTLSGEWTGKKGEKVLSDWFHRLK